jgi:cation diffusion facilitator CzcD-associated flavoprotein CzcO
MRLQLRGNRAVRKKVWPRHEFGCKRILFSSTYLPALLRPNCEVVTDRVTQITADGVVSADGRERKVDAIIWGTGFVADEPVVPMQVHGTGGHELQERWSEGARAHLGITVAGFPNLFLMYGPNTNLGHSSIIYMLESQARYIVDAVRTLDRADLASLEVRAETEHDYVADVHRKLERSVWNQGGCASWYLDRNGRNSVMWHTFTWRYRQATRRIDLDNYHLKAVPLNAL